MNKIVYSLSYDYLTAYPNELIYCNDYNSTITILKLIVGEIVVEKEEHEKKTKPRNFSVLPFEETNENEVIRANKYISIFTEEENYTDYETIRNFLLANRENNNIVKPILIELSNCLIKYDNEMFTSSFLHIYRCVENMTYIFPHIYAKCFNSYKGTYDALKDFFNQDKSEKELKMYKILSDKLFDGSLLVSSSFEFDYGFLDDNDFETIKKIFSNEYFGFQFEYYDKKVKIDFSNMFNFIITLRNRCFHMLEGTTSKYIKIDDLDFDTLFKGIVLEIVNWFSIVYVKLISKQFEQI